MPAYLESHWPLTEDRIALRETMRRFVDAEIIPNIQQWERDKQVPRSLYAKAGQAGLLGVAMPEEHGGVGGGILALIDFCDELSRAGSGGVLAALGSHQIGLPPIIHTASEEIKQRVLPAVIAGDKISALAITEPGGGSDVANLRTTAVRDGDEFVVNGEKTFITSGVQADYITAAVRTGGDGAAGVSLLLIETAATGGITRTKLDKMGWHCSDTAHIHFDNCRVPCANLIGRENHGFQGIMLNFNNERLMLSAQADATLAACGCPSGVLTVSGSGAPLAACGYPSCCMRGVL